VENPRRDDQNRRYAARAAADPEIRQGLAGTYELDNSPRDLTVKPTDTWVLEPVPGKTGQAATKSVITLTTCQDLFRSPDRSVAFGRLTRVEKKG
jgi:hypothetical protein